MEQEWEPRGGAGRRTSAPRNEIRFCKWGRKRVHPAFRTKLRTLEYVMGQAGPAWGGGITPSEFQNLFQGPQIASETRQKWTFESTGGALRVGQNYRALCEIFWKKGESKDWIPEMLFFGKKNLGKIDEFWCLLSCEGLSSSKIRKFQNSKFSKLQIPKPSTCRSFKLPVPEFHQPWKDLTIFTKRQKKKENKKRLWKSKYGRSRPPSKYFKIMFYRRYNNKFWTHSLRYGFISFNGKTLTRCS